MATTALPRYLRDIWRRTLKPAGWTWRFTGGDHIAFRSPAGATVFASLTPGKPDTVAMLVAQQCRRVAAGHDG